MSAPRATDSAPSAASNARLLAQRLVACAAKKRNAPSGDAWTVLVACQDTHRALVRSIGSVGADALLSRALTIAEKEHSVLREVPIDPKDEADATSLEAVIEKHGSSATSAGLEKLLELLLSLLERFVGIDVVVRLVAQSATIGTNEDEDAQ